MPIYSITYKNIEQRRAEIKRGLLKKYPNIGPRKLDILIRRKLGI